MVNLFLVTGPATAHGGDETQEGYLLVQQALAYLADDPSSDGMDLAMEKVDDTLAAEDQDGVDVAEVRQAKDALEAGDMAQAQPLLQHSIRQALAELPPATGEETGTTVVVAAQPGRGDLSAQDWAFLIASVLLLVAGVVLAYRFRPADNVGGLRRRLAVVPSRPDSGVGTHGTGTTS